MDTLKNKILCIEDSRIMQNIYKRMMEKADFAEEIIPAYNTEEAADYYKNLLQSSEREPSFGSADYPDLIFLDINIPIIGGWKFLEEFEKKFLEKFPKTRVIILTAAFDVNEKEKALKHDLVIDYLPKPLTFDMLHDIKMRLC